MLYSALNYFPLYYIKYVLKFNYTFISIEGFINYNVIDNVIDNVIALILSWYNVACIDAKRAINKMPLRILCIALYNFR